ncbi:YoaK family protein [Rhizobium leguminosarum]|uniref:YoaK family protein n=1 Tax=Rhizobium leguminosarum TaxID=384 RepID=UPI000487902B|nr:DUF1275 family protein [Rhizobium leguminosarum]
MRALPLSVLLSFNGGYVDTAGFLALQGLFTAHVTGNFVTLGATLAMGTAGALPKLLALPMFCVVVFGARVLSLVLVARGVAVLRPLLALKLLLLTAAAAFSVYHGPFVDADGPAVLVTGMTLVSAMAIQNGLHRAHLGKAPPTTLMTGTTTQIMLDIAGVVAGRGDDRAEAFGRMKKMTLAVLAFALGCGLAALAFIISPTWCFVPAVLIGAIATAARVDGGEPS